MKTRKLGENGFEVGEIGLGCWQLGGVDFGPLDAEEAHHILLAARDSGSNFFDTANVYGAGRSEELIGRFLRDHGPGITVASKTGREVYPDGYSEANLRKSILDTNEKLGLECLDLLQLHCIPHKVLQEGAIFDWLRGLKSEGLIKEFGASVESVEEGLTCLAHEDTPSLRDLIRSGSSDDQLSQQIRSMVLGKPVGHDCQIDGGTLFEGVMTAIGG